MAACADPAFLAERALGAERGLRATGSQGEDDIAASPAADELSERERAVLRMLPSGLSLREIGSELYVSHNTVKTHVRNIYAKLRVGSREDAVRWARELSLL